MASSSSERLPLVAKRPHEERKEKKKTKGGGKAKVGKSKEKSEKRTKGRPLPNPPAKAPRTVVSECPRESHKGSDPNKATFRAEAFLEHGAHNSREWGCLLVDAPIEEEQKDEEEWDEGLCPEQPEDDSEDDVWGQCRRMDREWIEAGCPGCPDESEEEE